MFDFVAKFIVCMVCVFLIYASVYPLLFVDLYILIRPLLQPIANKHMTLFSKVPLTGLMPLIMIFYSFLIAVFKKGYSLFVPKVFFLYFLLYLSLISFLNTSDYLFSLKHVFKLLTGISFYILVYNAIESKKDSFNLFKFVLFASLIPMIYGYYQFFTGSGKKFFFDFVRIKSLFVSANSYGIFLSLSFFVVFILLIYSKNKLQKILYILVLFSILISSILSLNRGSWIALFVSLMVSSIFFRKKISVNKIMFCVFLIFILFSPVIIRRFLELIYVYPWGDPRNTFYTRVNFWLIALQEIFPKHPFLGSGIGTTPLIFRPYFNIEVVPHNDYVRLLIECGLFAPLIYFLFLFKILLSFLDGRKKKLFKEDLYFYFFMSSLVIYWIIISFVQNPIYDVISFPLFLTLVAIGLKYSSLLEIKDYE